MTDAPVTIPPSVDEESVEQREVRLEKRARLLERGDAYPVAVPVTTTIAEVRRRFADLGPDERTGETVAVAGRVVHLRNTGKLCFAALQAGDGSRLQVMVSRDSVGEESLADFKSLVDLGDQLFVRGEVITSRRGELSVLANAWQVAAKALLPLPNLHAELSEETRVRSRYLDLIAREQARLNVVNRSKVVAIRNSGISPSLFSSDPRSLAHCGLAMTVFAEALSLNVTSRAPCCRENSSAQRTCSSSDCSCSSFWVETRQ